MRLIDADEVIEQFRQYRLVPAPKTKGEKAISVIFMDAIYRQAEIVKNAPTVEAEPKHGRWIRKESKRYWWWECSECGSPPPVNKYGGEWHSNYCPNCGARMDEVKE